MLRLNTAKLIKTTVTGQVSHPKIMPMASVDGIAVTTEGAKTAVPGIGGVAVGIHAGSSAYGWAADHLELGASTSNPNEKEAQAYYFFSSIGNRATMLSGEAARASGFVAGKHATNSVIVDFEDSSLAKIYPGDKICIEAYGAGLEFSEQPSIKVSSIDPLCLTAMLSQTVASHADSATLTMPVAAIIPPELLGSGLGYLRPCGDVDFMTSDWSAIVAHQLDDIKLGDIVLIRDICNNYGASYQRDAVSVGVVSHGDSKLAGHGPGLTLFLTAAKDQIRPVIDKTANIRKYHQAAYGINFNKGRANCHL